ncbi:hypothetical protein [Paraglaciecola sp. 20A4]|uniref:hypothetical protein n=1 Tax=Paraglaciecola sp. 20A4 TaxID=2687288 RepID=UPI001407301B|nr:hypothetical protein [Paraglaciecola sp. 20A4]
MDLADMFTHGLAFMIGALSLYFTAYTKAKGTNKALKEDIQSLEKAKQEIISKYASELESVKKEHQLDIDKRKYQYEDKRMQFAKFFRLIDEFNATCNSVFVKRFPPMHQRLLAGMLSDCVEASNQSLLDFNAEIMQLFNELNEDQLKVVHESNSIRLVATPQLDASLDQLELHVASSFNDTVAMLRFMGTPEYLLDKSTITPYQTKLTEGGNQVLSSREALRAQMKLELNEI